MAGGRIKLHVHGPLGRGNWIGLGPRLVVNIIGPELAVLEADLKCALGAGGAALKLDRIFCILDKSKSSSQGPWAEHEFDILKLLVQRGSSVESPGLLNPPGLVVYLTVCLDIFIAIPGAEHFLPVGDGGLRGLVGCRDSRWDNGG